MKTTKTFEVEIARVHKSSPYNCSAYLPAVRANAIEEVIELSEVQSLVKSTFGKMLFVRVYSNQAPCSHFLEYQIEKSRAIG